MLWVDKYRPKTLDQAIVHQDVAQNLKKLVAEQDCPHLLFYGPSGSGKKTLIIALLRQIFGPSADKVKVENRAWKVDAGSRTIDIELTTLSSTNHIELNPSDAGFQDRYIVQEIIKEMAKNRPIDTKGKKGYKVLVLNEVDKLSREAQHSLRRTMEKYSAYCRLILCCNSSSRVTEAIRSRCLNVRINSPTEDQIVKVLESIGKKEGLQLPSGFVARIAEKSNRSLRRAILSLETCRVQQYPFTSNQTVESKEGSFRERKLERERERERGRERERELERDLMEYERIHKVQTGIISPSKLRMKLIGPHHHKKKDGSNSNSSRTSPSKLDDSEFVKNSLLDPMNGDEEVTSSSLEVLSMNLLRAAALDVGQSDQASCQPKESLPRENSDAGRVKLQHYAKGESGNSSAIHPVRMMDDENLDYDSNASSSSFEFHKGEKSVHKHLSRTLSRTMPSKWNDAEKWIMSKQIVQANFPRKSALQNQTIRLPVTNMVRVVPESANYDYKPNGRGADTKRVDFCQPSSQIGFDKFSFVPSESQLSSGQASDRNALFDESTQSKDLMEVGHGNAPCSKSTAENTAGTAAIRAVSMRDMGTEMTPIPSQEPSRTATPEGATTPLRSPISSMPSTPRGGAPAPTPTTDGESRPNNKKQLSEEELKLKTRREIVELGVQLGKMNIAAWASKDEQEKKLSAEKTDAAELQRIEYEKRAAAWEEAEKCRHTARYKRDEIQIQAWESQQKAKLEAEMRRIEAQVEQMRAQAQSKIVKKITLAKQRSEEKRAAAEARKNQNAEKTAAQAEYIRQTGRMPSYNCCGWL